MRNTSWRRRSGTKIRADMSRMDAGRRSDEEQKVPLLADDDPTGITCSACGVRVRLLACGRPVAHAAGGYKPSTTRGLYKCEGSGSV